MQVLRCILHCGWVCWQVWRWWCLSVARLEGFAVGGVLLILLSMVIAPMWLLLLCPLLFGIPHVLGDLWVLFLRPHAPRQLLAVLGLPLLAMTGIRLRFMMGGPLWTAGELCCGVADCLLAGLWGGKTGRMIVVAVLGGVAHAGRPLYGTRP